MKAWWFGLQVSERRTLSLGGVSLILIVIYFGGWAPLQDDILSLEKQVQEQQAVKRWMQQSATEVEQLRGSGSSQTRHDGRSLLAIVDQTAKNSRLGSNLKRLEPEGSGVVKVWLEQVSFDDMMAWLLSLETQQGLIVSTITIDRQESSGHVNARMTLKGSS